MSATEAGSTAPSGWYPEPGTGRQRYWTGTAWGDYAPVPAAGGAPAYTSAPAASAPAGIALNVYAETVDPNQVLSPEQREAYKRHTLTTFPTWAVVVLSILTLGIFGTICHLLKHSKLPVVKPDDPSAGKAIGFLFIPIFNLYWTFVVWLRLVDRINFQYRLRGRPAPISRNLALWAIISSFAGWVVGIGLLVGPILALIAAAQIQTAANKLAEGQV